MKRYLKKIFLFIIPIAVIAYPIDLYFSHVLKKVHQHPGGIEIMNDIYSKKLDTDIVIYGSSRAFTHINPRILEDSLKLSVYNLGFTGHNFWLQYVRHRLFLKYNKKPHTIIYSLDLLSFDRKDDLSPEIQFLPYMLWNKEIYNYIHSFDGVKTADFFIPMLRYFGNFKSLYPVVKISIEGEPKKRFTYRGFAPIDLPWNGNLSLHEIAAQDFTLKLDEDCVRLFEHFLDECKSDGIQVILVYTPEFFDRQRYTLNREDIMDYYRSVARKFGLAFIDFSDDAICKEKKYFFNGSHLNDIGADVFTKRLVPELRKLYF